MDNKIKAKIFGFNLNRILFLNYSVNEIEKAVPKNMKQPIFN